MELSSEQQNVIDKVLAGENVFMTGPGGTGKSYVIQKIVEMTNKYTKVCAMTGVAAELLKCSAKTIHSWSGMGRGTLDPERLLAKVMRNKQARNSIKKVEILIIDEVSMMSVKFFQLLEFVLRRVRKSDHHFGGVTVLFSGDFYQLPPIGEKGSLENDNSRKFCFQCELWNKIFPIQNVIQLTKFYRQKDPLFTKILMQIRKGVISRNTFQILSRKKEEFKHDPSTSPTIIYPRRNLVNNENKKHMDKLSTKSHMYTSQVAYKEEFYLQKDLPQSLINNEIKRLQTEMNGEKELELKIGSHVMCIVNIESSLVNGSQGVVIDIIDDIPLVKFHNGITKSMDFHCWESDEIPGLCIKQIPLILSWAITIHKSQGVTLDNAIIDAGSTIFEYGQVYVAFSRVKTLDGILLKDFDPYSIKTNPSVKEFYKSLG
jgi:ATP-dependent DNA helicase PIF1